MAFVHGHPRDLGWVKAHWRRPNQAEDGQLPLLAVADRQDGEEESVELPALPPTECEPG